MPLPMMESYLAQLPDGWASFPKCQAKAALIEDLARFVPDLGREPLPARLGERLAEPALATSWAPEVEFIALMMAVCDVRGATPSDEARLFDEVTQLNVALFRRREYRPLIASGDPGRVIDKMSRSWHRFHRGTDFACIETATEGLVLELTYPPALYPPQALRMRKASVAGVLIACGAPDATIEIDAVVAGRARYRVRW